MAGKQQAFPEIRGKLRKREECKDKVMQNHTLAVARRGSPGGPVKLSDQVVVKESGSSLSTEGTNIKLAHGHWTGLWQVTWVQSELRRQPEWTPEPRVPDP